MRSLFGTDGIRGQANVHPMTCEVALALGRAVAYQARAGAHRHRIVIGKDTRLSGYMLEMAFASGVCSMGVDVLLVGPMPTPGVAFLTQNMRADAGVVISASHNPYQDNGIKIFARDGYKLPDSKELELEALMQDTTLGSIRPTKSAVGKAFRIDDAMGRYMVALKAVLPSSQDFEPMRIVIDCAHGAAYKVAPTVLRELGALVIALGDKPDGRNINRKCGALYPGHLAQVVKQKHADIGIALDGDADRLIVVDEQGELVHGDQLLALLASDLLAHQQLAHNTVVITQMSNLALDRYLAHLGAKVVRTQVGDRYVMQAMREQDYVFGGEQSGHIIYRHHSTTGDGLLAALKLLQLLKTTQLPLSTLKQSFTPYPQILRNLAVTQRQPLEKIPALQTLIGECNRQLGSEGRVMVRLSGTEPLVRILLEGKQINVLEHMADRLTQCIQTHLH